MRSGFITFFPILLVAALAVSGSVHAHRGGHGPRVEGTGPNGGPLTSIISAADVEQGQAAAIQGVAEWNMRAGKLTVHLWNKTRKSKSPISAQSEIKWILLASEGAPPKVITTKLKSDQASLSHQFDEADWKNAHALEVILPHFGKARHKHVLFIPLKK